MVSSAFVNQTSVFRGVSCCGKDRKYQARIRDGNKVHYLGRFGNEFDAAITYDEAAREYKGDLAMPNFVVMDKTTTNQVRAHFFANKCTIGPEFYHVLLPETLDRVRQLAVLPGSSTSTTAAAAGSSNNNKRLLLFQLRRSFQRLQPLHRHHHPIRTTRSTKLPDNKTTKRTRCCCARKI